MPPIRVLLADDHTVLRSGLRMLLDGQSDVEVVGEAGDGSEALRRTRELRPDVVLLDISMPGPPSGDVIRRVLKACPATRVVVLTMHDDPAYLASAMTAGAAGYVVKKVADTELLSAIRAVHGGRTFVDVTKESSRALALADRADPQRGPVKDLSRRELDVLRLLAQGHTNRQVADRISVSVKTVETYRMRLGEKLGLRGRSELYRFAVESGILRNDSVEPTEG